MELPLIAPLDRDISPETVSGQEFIPDAADFQFILESSLAAGGVGIWDFDLVHDRIIGDRNLHRMYGIDPDRAGCGTPLAAYVQVIHPEDVASMTANLQSAIESADRFEAEYRIVVKGEPIRWVTARGRVDRDPQGKAIRLPGVVMDITAQRKAEQELHSTMLRWKLALESAELGAWNLDASDHTLRSDKRFRTIFQGSDEPLAYEQAFARIHPDDRENVRKAVGAAITPPNPAPYAEEYRVVHADGTILWVLGKGRANFEGEGPHRRLTSLDGTVADITEKKKADTERLRAEEELREVASKLSEADRRKDEFLATLAHELRNPLAPIRTGLEIMRVAAGDAPVIEKLRLMMESQTQQLVRLIDDLMDVSRIASGKVELRKEIMDLRLAVRSAIDATKAAMESSRHHFAATMPDEPVWLNADSTRVSQVISNLLTNAARYTDPGGEISLNIERRDADVMVSVRDTGIGVPPEMLDQIFEMFAQVDQSSEKSQGGLGIGLTLVKRLTELHGGAVEVRSGGEGKGSEFLITLPLMSNHAGPENDATEMEAPVGRRVMVVDDNQAAAETLTAMLRLAGNDVRTAKDGVECIEMALNFRPEVILMDLGMPNMNGYEAARHIRQQEWGGEMLLVALTGWGQDRDRANTSEAGFDRHLIKPVEPSALADLFRDVSR